MSNGELSYPNLAGCKVVVQSSIAPSRLPVHLSRECWDAANISIEPLYAFTLEKSVLEKKKEKDLELSMVSTGSREDMQRSMLIKMKSVTNANEDLCISILESNGYDLKSSIEAYFQAN